MGRGGEKMFLPNILVDERDELLLGAEEFLPLQSISLHVLCYQRYNSYSWLRHFSCVLWFILWLYGFLKLFSSEGIIKFLRCFFISVLLSRFKTLVLWVSALEIPVLQVPTIIGLRWKMIPGLGAPGPSFRLCILKLQLDYSFESLELDLQKQSYL